MTEEEAIFKSQQLDLIYAQSGMLYEIIPDAPWLNYDPRQNLGPHVDGIIGSKNAKSTDQVTNQMQNLSLNQSAWDKLRLHPLPPNRRMYILCSR
jgi:hypothetical protein